MSEGREPGPGRGNAATGADRFEIPAERLPPGFVERIERPPAHPSEPVPAATVVLLRDGVNGLETLLMRRHRRSGFVPGAYVFPGGRVDEGDADPALLAACIRPPPAEPPAAYRFAGIREVFEETGVRIGLVEEPDAEDAAPGPAPVPGQGDDRVPALREDLLEDRIALADLVRDLRLGVEPDALVYFAHWITPVAESRRYDTRFFLAGAPPGQAVSPDPREMTDAVWIRPADALDRFRAGRLPMVFPTVHSLESLVAHDSVAAALSARRDRAVPATLPRLVRTGSGVSIVVDPAGHTNSRKDS